METLQKTNALKITKLNHKKNAKSPPEVNMQLSGPPKIKAKKSTKYN